MVFRHAPPGLLRLTIPFAGDFRTAAILFLPREKAVGE